MLDDFDAMTARVPGVEVDRTVLGAIEGWLGEPDLGLTLELTRLQRARTDVTGVLELGVHHGRYLALLAAAHPEMGVPLVGVDALMVGDGTRLAPADRAIAIERVQRNVAAVAGDEAQVQMIGSFTRDVDLDDLRARCPPGFSFISVDAGHEAPDVAIDLDIAVAVAGPSAVIAMDDAFNPRTPGVNEAIARHLGREGSGGLLPFATGGNKLYAATTEESRQLYLSYCHWLMDTRSDVPFVATSARIRAKNRTHRFVPEYFGHELATFLYPTD